jgi:hypothetical protein
LAGAVKDNKLYHTYLFFSNKAGVHVTKVWAICVLLFVCSLSFAQKKPLLFRAVSKPIHQDYVHSKILIPRDSVRILAIMVEFQKDADEKTTGDGTFQQQGSPEQIDPPPHDSTYFKNKLRFIENYYRQVSNGILTVKSDLCSQYIVTLSNHMSDYAPPTNLDDKSKLVEFIKESWQKADTLYPGIDFANYDAFVIFHAGAGRDIDLVSLLLYNPTPFDIPSLFLDSTVISNILGSPSGIPIRNNTVFIKNTIILPETESRVINTGYGNETLEYSINGLFAASLGNYLGLPDLFDTKTGRSAIGQFGLMDGAGIFAYNGLFPPEPSAWEKMYLGWVKPITIQSSWNSLPIPAVGLTRSGQDTIYKIPISSSEYFLVENRNRNPEGNGINIEIADTDGNIFVRHFNQDTIGFNYNDVSEINGSVVDVSDFDWAVVGETDGTGRFDGGGVLIWHIDENVIEAGIGTDAINTDIDHRGVDLEEADGSQDIGQIFEFLEPGSYVQYGSPLDFWFSGNVTVLYKNVFDRNSFPNSNSYSGAASLITIKEFSTRAPRMTISVEIGNRVLLRRDPILYHKLSNASNYSTSTGKHLYIPTHEGLFAFQSNGLSLTNDTSGILLATKNIGEVAVYRSSGSDSIFVAGVHNDTLEIVQLTYPNVNGIFDSLYVYRSSINRRFSTSPCFLMDTILVGTDSGFVYKFTSKGVLISQLTFGNGPITSFAQLPTPLKYYCTSGNRIYSELDSVDLPVSSNKWILAAAVSPEGDYIIAAEKNGNIVMCFNQTLSKKIFEVNVPGSALQELAIADLDGDGEKDLIIQSTTHLSAFNRIGVLLDGFPIQAIRNNEFNGTPIVVDINEDGNLEIVTFTFDGEMWIYDKHGKLLSGYPIQVCSSGSIFPMAYINPSDTIGIAVLSENDSLNAFLTSGSVTATSLAWWQHLADERHRNAEWSQTAINPISNEFLPKLRAYNWPNPVYGLSTHIRYYTSEDADVTITILDLSGVKITELKGRGIKGMDNEITWDVSNIQSGVYLARIEAKSSSRSDVAFVKIAVVK